MGFSIGTSGMDMGGPRGSLEQFGEQVEGKTFDVSIIWRMMSFMRPYRLKIIIAFIAMLGSSTLTIITPLLVKVAIDQPIAEGDLNGLNQLVLVMLGAFVAIYITTTIQQYLLSWVGQRVLTDLRSAMFSHLQALSLGYHDTHIVGVTISRVISDVGVINQLLSEGLVTLLGDTILLAGIILVMMSMNLQLALVAFSVIPLMLIVTALFARRAKAAFRNTRARIAALIGDLAENLSGMRVIQAFAHEDLSIEHFDAINRDNRDANIEAMTLSFVFLPTVEFLGMLATALLLLFGGMAVSAQTITLGTVIAFLAYVTRFFQPIQELSQLYATMQTAMAGGERVLTLLDTPPAVADRDTAQAMPVIEGHIEFKDVSFAYNKDHLILHHVNLDVQAGQMLALVGPTGAGKSSIANLIARFYEVSDGAVLIDGHDVRDVKQQSLRQQMGLVSQDPFIFSGTIADNIRFGIPAATMEGIQSAGKLANIHDFIMSLPDGYETAILEDGANLSIGQRQLISIARAVLANPRILIMDEATSSVDMMTEALIQDALENLLHNRTSVVIAHRLSTIVKADIICVIDDGNIIERGTHEELIAQNGLYKQLYDRQFVDSLD